MLVDTQRLVDSGGKDHFLDFIAQVSQVLMKQVVKLSCSICDGKWCYSAEKDDFDQGTHLLVKIHNTCFVYLKNKPGPSVSR